MLGSLVVGAMTLASWRTGGFGSEASGNCVVGSLAMATTCRTRAVVGCFTSQGSSCVSGLLPGVHLLHGG
jgi:hypothetical protein